MRPIVAALTPGTEPAAGSRHHGAGLFGPCGRTRTSRPAAPEPERCRDRPGDRPGLPRLRAGLGRPRRNGFAFGRERSEHGLVAVGVPLRDRDGAAPAGLSVSMPGVRRAPTGAGTGG
ncbi:IclR family transcriptional regulator C-terminal domain-containing protein [Streptomyces sp. HK10]|uniref:IclR family transcriptional regulator domain-containing protein n=1 Tax=Streptomyces sp. HK10 TaxID=3373255 RepID=UPI003748BF1B